MAISYARLADLRHRLSLPVLRRVSGAIEGRHRSIFTGHGQDFDDMVPYLPGDDVSDIDWKASARAGQPIIRRFVKETNLQVLLAVDTSRAMTASAPSGEPKMEIAIELVDLLAYLAKYRSDLLALVVAEGSRVTQLPPRSGTAHLELIRHRLRSAATNPSDDDALLAVLRRAETLVQRRSLIVVIGDEWSLGPECEAVLKRLRIRHEVLFFAINDFELENLGDRDAVDVVDGVLPAFAMANTNVRREVAVEVERNRLRQADLMRRLGIRSVALHDSEGIVDALLTIFGRSGT